MNKKQFILENFIISLWNNRNFKICHRIFTPDFITQSLGYNVVDWKKNHGIGPQSMTHHIKDWLQKIPDAQMTIRNIYEDHNSVMTHWILKGTLKGKILNSKPTDKIITISGCTIFHFERNKIKLNETLVDTCGLLSQIGALNLKS